MKVILVHGFYRDKKDFFSMKKDLENWGYECLVPTLPLTYQEFCRSTVVLKEVIQKHTQPDERIHLVGHSTGGLVIRHLLMDEDIVRQVGRAVLIATPNRGSYLATLAGRMKWYVSRFRTLKSLDRAYIDQLNIEAPNGVEIGAIAGTKSKGLLGRLIREENDGKVELSSVPMDEFKDFIILPYHHLEIHHKERTANFVKQFLENGHFKGGI